MSKTPSPPSVSKNKRTRHKSKKTTGTNPTVVIAWIGVITIIITGLFAYKPFEKWMDSRLNPESTPTVFQTVPAPTSTFTETAMPFVTDTYTPIPFETPTFTPVTTATVAPSATVKMSLEYSVSRTTGKVPLLVTINANGSTFTLGDGSVNSCNVTKSCVFTFRITHNGEQWIEPQVTKDGKFSYTFRTRGDYIFTIVVCRDDVCGADQVIISAN